jgi:hypothetical protein
MEHAMTPIRTQDPIRHEKFSAGAGPEINIPYFRDVSSQDWVSVMADHYTFARNAVNVRNQFLRLVNGVQGTSTTGYWVPRPAKLTWLSFVENSAGGPTGQRLRVWGGGGLKVSFVLPTGTADILLSLDTILTSGPGSVSVDIVDDGGGPFLGPNNPIVRLGFRWRLT